MSSTFSTLPSDVIFLFLQKTAKSGEPNSFKTLLSLSQTNRALYSLYTSSQALLLKETLQALLPLPDLHSEAVLLTTIEYPTLTPSTAPFLLTTLHLNLRLTRFVDFLFAREKFREKHLMSYTVYLSFPADYHNSRTDRYPPQSYHDWLYSLYRYAARKVNKRWYGDDEWPEELGESRGLLMHQFDIAFRGFSGEMSRRRPELGKIRTKKGYSREIQLWRERVQDANRLSKAVEEGGKGMWRIMGDFMGVWGEWEKEGWVIDEGDEWNVLVEKDDGFYRWWTGTESQERRFKVLSKWVETNPNMLWDKSPKKSKEQEDQDDK